MERAARTDVTPTDEADAAGAAAEHARCAQALRRPGVAAGRRAAQERGCAHISKHAAESHCWTAETNATLQGTHSPSKIHNRHIK